MQYFHFCYAKPLNTRKSCDFVKAKGFIIFFWECSNNSPVRKRVPNNVSIMGHYFSHSAAEPGKPCMTGGNPELTAPHSRSDWWDSMVPEADVMGGTNMGRWQSDDRQRMCYSSSGLHNSCTLRDVIHNSLSSTAQKGISLSSFVWNIREHGWMDNGYTINHKWFHLDCSANLPIHVRGKSNALQFPYRSGSDD